MAEGCHPEQAVTSFCQTMRPDRIERRLEKFALDRYASFLYKAVRRSVGEARAGTSLVEEKMDPDSSQSRLVAFVLRQSFAFAVPSSRRIV